MYRFLPRVALAVLLIGLLSVPTQRAQAASTDETNSLTDLYNQLDGTNWTTRINWTTGDPCTNSWFGVTCNGSGDVIELSLSNNGLNGDLSTVDLSGLTNLQTLTLSQDLLVTGDLDSIDLSGLTSLRTLNLRGTSVSGSLADLSANSTLTTLDLTDTNISGAVGGLDFSTYTNLEFVYLSNNNGLNGDISGVSFPNGIALRELWLLNTSVSGDIGAYNGSGAADLEILALTGTDLTGDVIDLDLSPHPKLGTLFLGNVLVGGDISNLDLTNNPDLIDLALFSNQVNGDIAGLDVTANTKLEELIVFDISLSGDIGDLDVTNNTALTDLRFDGNTNLGGDIGALDLTNNMALESLNLSGTRIGGDIGALDLTNNMALERLNLSGTRIGGEISGLDLTQNTALANLQIADTNVEGQVWDYFLATNYPNLSTLDLSGSCDLQMSAVAAVNTFVTGLDLDAFTSNTNDCQPDGDPTGLNATYDAANDEIDLTWTDNTTNEEDMIVERSDNGGSTWAVIATLPADTITYSDAMVDCGESYTYRVKAVNVSGESAYSNTATAAPLACPADPTSLNATYDAPNDEIDLVWNDNAGNESAYTVERSDNGGSTWAVIATLPADTITYSDASVDCGTSYDYRVRATNASGESAYSNVAIATTPDCQPDGDPTDLTATYDEADRQVELAWNDTSSNEEGFRVERQKEGASGWVTLTTTAPDAESYTDETATCDQTYRYRVTATNANGDSSPAVSSTVATPCDIFADSDALPAPFMETWVEDFFRAGITQGCAENPPEYCGDEPVTRGAMAVFLIRAREYPNLPYTPQGDASDPFVDVPSDLPAPFMEDWVEDFLALGITQGCNAGTPGVDLRFCPDEPVTRGAMAVFILRALEGENYTPQGDASNPFVDVPSDLPAPFMEDWVEDFYDRGITTGCNNGTPGVDLRFCPDEPVTRGAMAVFMLRAFDSIPDPEDP